MNANKKQPTTSDSDKSESVQHAELGRLTMNSQLFPEDPAARKAIPVGTFIKDYFPNAIAALAKHSYDSQQQHGKAENGAPMEWLKDRSVGDGNEIIRHYMEGEYAAMAWRSLELLEREILGIAPFNNQSHPIAGLGYKQR